MGLILPSSWKVAHSSMQALSSGLRRSHLVDFFSGAYLQVSPTNSTNNQINVEQVQRSLSAVRDISEFRKKLFVHFSLMESPNFYARMTYGNKKSLQSGIKNLHLNIRSIRNKMSDIKAIVKQKKPHIFGISECELWKFQNNFDESRLKVPGYDLLLPKSWSRDPHGYARVIMYVKSSLQYVQLHELEDNQVQSIWIEGGFKNSKKIIFCHTYREHTNSMGNSLKFQKNNLEIFLQQ